jgi:hypothetical protein
MRTPERAPAPVATRLATVAAAFAVTWPAAVFAQSLQTAPADAWRYSATVYLYMPSIGGSSNVPVDSGGTTINVDASQILDTLKFTFMGSLDAHNGRWGAFTDFIYLNFGDTKEGSRDFTIGDSGLPAGTTANLDWTLKGVSWTVAGQYRVAAAPDLTVDALFGTRLLDIRTTIKWDIAGSLGPIAPEGRTGSNETKLSNWDAIVGARGRYVLDAGRKWSVPFYVDVGTGQSELTWQAAAGISYAFSWGELSGMYRYLDYRLKSGNVLDSVSFKGPLVAATFRW